MRKVLGLLPLSLSCGECMIYYYYYYYYYTTDSTAERADLRRLSSFSDVSSSAVACLS